MLGTLTKWLKGLRKKSHPAYISTFQVESGTTNQLYVDAGTNATVSWQPSQPTVYEHEREVPKDERIVKKPIEVVADIIAEEPKMNLIDVKQQIRVVKRRIRILQDECNIPTPSDELEALKYLKARLKYQKYADRFRWAITTNAKIKELLAKYKLSDVNFRSYYKNVPMEAIDEIEKFIAACKKVTDAESEFRLIIDDGGTETKKDPIMYASSPFGKWFYVIGAWDKEIMYVDDIIYHGK